MRARRAYRMRPKGLTKIDKLSINSSSSISKYLLHHNTVKVLVIGCFLISLVFGTSFGLTEAVDLFGQTNSVDLVLNDIWIEPENPKEGEAVTVHGSLYNSGIIPSGEVSDAVTVGYVVNGELLEINLIENILPGVENGVEISSGPIFDAVSNEYIVTVIVNYHDTLSHLRDNQENNIVQKRFQIGSKIPSLIKYNIMQNYDGNTDQQRVTIQGELTNIFEKKLENQKIIVEIDNNQETATSNKDGEFLIDVNIAFKDEPIDVTVTLEDEFSFPEASQKIFPIKLDKGESALGIQPISLPKNLEDATLTIVIFQDSYDALFKKISTKDLNSQSKLIEDTFLITLPANHEYIVEIYMEGKFLTAFQDYFDENTIINEKIFFSDPAEIRFKVVDEFGEPQPNAIINNWIYSAVTDENGLTDWIEVLPTINEAYVAKTTFADESVTWSEPFFVESDEKKVIRIIKGGIGN